MCPQKCSFSSNKILLNEALRTFVVILYKNYSILKQIIHLQTKSSVRTDIEINSFDLFSILNISETCQRRFGIFANQGECQCVIWVQTDDPKENLIIVM